MSFRLRPRIGWGTVTLLTLLLLSVAWSINAAKWTDGLWTLQPAVLGGLLVGLVLASIRRLPGILAHTLSLVLGIAWLVFVTAWLLPWDYTWPQAIAELYARFAAWLKIAMGSGTSGDNLIFVMQLEFLMWVIGYAGAWFLVRTQNVWGAVIPSGLAMMVNIYYAPQIDNWLAFYLLMALLLIVRTFVLQQEEEWQRAHVGYNPDIGFDFLRDGTIFAALIVFVTWFAPTMTTPPVLQTVFDRFAEPLGRTQSTFNRLFSALNYRTRPGPAYFSNTLAFSGPVNLGDTPVFDASTTSGRYWRSVVFDQYTSRGWVNTDSETTILSPDDQRLALQPFEARVAVTQTVTTLQSGGTMLYAQALPMGVNLGTRAQYSPLPGDIAGQAPLNVSMLNSRTPLKAGQSYQVVSAMSAATVKQLQAAGGDYPGWVKDRYLQVPDSLPARVRELAQQITGSAANPYDKATALETYLRNLPYNDKIAAPPPGRDGVDYFLFDVKQGYCDYYASAMVMMARAVGIPARIAAGYASGEYDTNRGVFRQREFDAHSWPELFFPNYGWIEFEPTSGEPAIARQQEPLEGGLAGLNERLNPQDRPDRDPNIPQDQAFGSGGLPFGLGAIGNPGLTRLLWVLGALILVLLVAAGVSWYTWRRGLRGLSVVAGLYERMTRLGRLLGVVDAPSQTPYEYAGTLGRALPDGQVEIDQIADGYVRERFSGRKPGDDEGSGLAAVWIRLRQVLVRGVIDRGLSRVTGQRRRKTE